MTTLNSPHDRFFKAVFGRTGAAEFLERYPPADFPGRVAGAVAGDLGGCGRWSRVRAAWISSGRSLGVLLAAKQAGLI